MSTTLASPTFRQGDEVEQATGTYQGTLTERNGLVRSHPVAWLAHT